MGLQNEKIAVVGLGYVGLPVAIAFAKQFDNVVGFDISESRVQSLNAGLDRTGEIDQATLSNSTLLVTSDAKRINDSTIFIVTVPTPIDSERRPDLRPLRDSCQIIGPYLKHGDIVVFESTVFPGATEDICGPILESVSGLKSGSDFFLGYSPERINPGDKENRLETIVKVVAAQNPEALKRVGDIYGRIIEAGLHFAPSIRVAEAAKVIENTQRDLNIALMNELSLIFDRMGIRTADVLEAAATKWNFLRFAPGLVGGHCIGVDPYYLTSAAESLGYRPEVILAGRRINDDMGGYVARKTVKLLIAAGKNVLGSKVGILGLSFKEDVPDLRNSKIPDIVSELKEYGVNVTIHDPHADAEEAMHEYGLSLTPIEAFRDLDAVVYAVPHAAFAMTPASLSEMTAKNGVIIDVKSRFDSSQFSDRAYWSL